MIVNISIVFMLTMCTFQNTFECNQIITIPSVDRDEMRLRGDAIMLLLFGLL